ncbi:MAG: O-methyltransferase [Nocardioidaceae bacterium]
MAPNQGKLLKLLAQLTGAQRVLEIGTLGGYSTIWLARGLPDSGRIVTLEAEPRHAAVATENLERAGVGFMVDVRVAPALETLPRLVDEGVEPFDLVFIDADKPNNSHYLRWALELTRAGSLIVVDNVVRRGEILDRVCPAGGDVASSADAVNTENEAAVAGARAVLKLAGSDPRLDATALQTVSSKGWDGFLLALVKA